MSKQKEANLRGLRRRFSSHMRENISAWVCVFRRSFVVIKFEKQTGMQCWEITFHQSIPRHFQRR